jgi:hypothetical protein
VSNQFLSKFCIVSCSSRTPRRHQVTWLLPICVVLHSSSYCAQANILFLLAIRHPFESVMSNFDRELADFIRCCPARPNSALRLSLHSRSRHKRTEFVAKLLDLAGPATLNFALSSVCAIVFFTLALTTLTRPPPWQPIILPTAGIRSRPIISPPFCSSLLHSLVPLLASWHPTCRLGPFGPLVQWPCSRPRLTPI